MIALIAAVVLQAQTFPPKLPDGKDVVTDTSDDFLKPGKTLQSGVAIAKTPPTIDFLYFPGQDYAGKPWSNWGTASRPEGSTTRRSAITWRRRATHSCTNTTPRRRS